MSNNLKGSENFSEDLVYVNRVTKVVKGGRNFSFSAVVVIGNEKGKVGCGNGKAKEVAEARAKATKNAKKRIISVPLYQGRTIHHDVMGRSGAARVILRRAAPGTGVIAGGPLRSVFGRLGIEDIVAKSLGSSNPNSMIAAAFDALEKLRAPKSIAHKRGRTISNLSVNSV